MRTLPEKVCLVIPCFNERERLTHNALLLRQCPFPLVFVNDGSEDGTGDWIRSQNHPQWHLIELPVNKGKAEAVRQGMIEIHKWPDFASISWAGFWDADLSTPLEEIPTLLLYQETFYPEAKAIFGSRVLRLGSHIERFPYRHILGRLFATIVSLLFPKFTIYDSQCGAKLFRREILDAAFSKPFISRWLFDIEILMRIGPAQAIECPLTHWQEKSGGKLKIFPNIPSVILDLYHLWITYR